MAVQVMLTPHLRTGNGSCAARALALAENMTMEQAEAWLAERTNYTSQNGVRTNQLEEALKELGYRFIYQRTTLTAKFAVQRLPSEAMLWFSERKGNKRIGHLVYYLDGVVYDSYTTTRWKGSKQIKGYYIKG